MQYQIPKADVDAVVQCKPGAIEQASQRLARICGGLAGVG